MASLEVRNAIYNAMVASSALAALGYIEDTIFPNFGPDSPYPQRFCVLRWGAMTRGVGRANTVQFTPWFYDRDQDYSAIVAGLLVLRPVELGGVGLLDTLVGVRISTSSILGIDWQGAGTDLFDDAYEANTRNETYNITATGN